MPPSPTSLSPDALSQLAQNDFAAFKAQFLSFFPDDQRPRMRSTGPIACMLGATTATLEDLGLRIPFSDARPMELRDVCRWHQLLVDLAAAGPEDLKVMFLAVARSLQGRSMADCGQVMEEVLKMPADWTIDVIEAIPRFFRTSLPEGLAPVSAASGHDLSIPAANAFQLLADVNPVNVPHTYTSMRQTLQALKRAGAVNTRNPKDGSTCLHTAVLTQPASLLRAFVDEFPDSVNDMKWNGCRPLDLATLSVHHGNVKVLLEAGAEPRASVILNATPLRFAVEKANYDAVKVLLETCAYSVEDVEVACEGARDVEGAVRVRAMHAAVKACVSVTSVENVTGQLQRL